MIPAGSPVRKWNSPPAGPPRRFQREGEPGRPRRWLPSCESHTNIAHARRPRTAHDRDLLNWILVVFLEKSGRIETWVFEWQIGDADEKCRTQLHMVAVFGCLERKRERDRALSIWLTIIVRSVWGYPFLFLLLLSQIPPSLISEGGVREGRVSAWPRPLSIPLPPPVLGQLKTIPGNLLRNPAPLPSSLPSLFSVPCKLKNPDYQSYWWFPQYVLFESTSTWHNPNYELP